MSAVAMGAFSVEIKPESEPNADASVSLGRMSLANSFVSGSAGDVAIECVSGTLHGKSGNFAFQDSSASLGFQAQHRWGFQAPHPRRRALL